MKHAISGFEETWVKVCSIFLNAHPDWSVISKEQAFKEMFISSKGSINPASLKNRIEILYAEAGIKS